MNNTLPTAYFVQIEKWPGSEEEPPITSQFSAPYKSTLDLLDKELFQLEACEIVFQSYYSTRQLGRDGWPYARERPTRPGVILQFKSKGNTISLPSNRFETFEDNMRALALSLEALRKVDRFGVTRNGEQYQGWKQIESPGEPFRSKEEAAKFISACGYGDPIFADVLLRRPELRAKIIRQAMLSVHPDVPKTGDHEKFLLLQEAARILNR